jgi:hypothetical protein
VPALSLLGHQTVDHQPIEVLARGRAGDAGPPRELSCRPRPAVEQGQAKRRPRAIGQGAGQPCHLGRAVIGAHPPTMPARQFGAHRTGRRADQAIAMNAARGLTADVAIQPEWRFPQRSVPAEGFLQPPRSALSGDFRVDQ